MMLRSFRLGLAGAFSDWAQRRRDLDFAYRVAWERETEPGFPMGPSAEAFGKLSLTIADLQDSLADTVRPAARKGTPRHRDTPESTC